MGPERDSRREGVPGCANISQQEWIDLANESIREEGGSGHWTSDGNRTFYVGEDEIVVNGRAVKNDPLS